MNSRIMSQAMFKYMSMDLALKTEPWMPKLALVSFGKMVILWMSANQQVELQTTLLKLKLLQKLLKLPKINMSESWRSFLIPNMFMIASSLGCRNGNKMVGRHPTDNLSRTAMNWNVWKVSCLNWKSNGAMLKVIVATMEMTGQMNLPNLEHFSNNNDLSEYFLHFIEMVDVRRN